MKAFQYHDSIRHTATVWELFETATLLKAVISNDWYFGGDENVIEMRFTFETKEQAIQFGHWNHDHDGPDSHDPEETYPHNIEEIDVPDDHFEPASDRV